MRVVYFNPIGGAAGDMITGAMLDVGLSLEALRRELAKVPVRDYELASHRVLKLGVAATQLHVLLHIDDRHQHDHPLAEGGGYLKLTEIEHQITDSGLDGAIKRTVLRILRRLGEAEARSQGRNVAELAWEEPAAIDSVVDIVAAVAGMNLLGIERVYCGAFPLWNGTLETEHGSYPIPSPITLELIRAARAPTVFSGTELLQVTATGAAILTTLASFERPRMCVERSGFGAGEADLAVPNVIGLAIGETDEKD